MVEAGTVAGTIETGSPGNLTNLPSARLEKGRELSRESLSGCG